MITLAKASCGGYPGGAIGMTEELAEIVADGTVNQYGTFNGNPLVMAAAEATLTEVLTDDAYEQLEATNRRLLDGCQEIIDAHGLPAYTEGLGAKGCVIFSPERLYEYRDYLTKVDDELSTLAWLYHMNHGIFMTPGVEEEWTLSIAHTTRTCSATSTPSRPSRSDVGRRLSADGRSVGASAPRLATAGAAEVEALGHVDAVLAQHLGGRVVLDELGDRRLAEAAGDLDDRLHGELVGVVAGHVADEVAVDLDQVEGQVLEVVEGAEAGAVVVDRDLAAELGEPVGEGRRRCRSRGSPRVSVISKVQRAGSASPSSSWRSMNSSTERSVSEAPERLTWSEIGSPAALALGEQLRAPGRRPSGRAPGPSRPARRPR